MASITVKEKGTSDTDTCTYNKVDRINNNDIDFCYISTSPAFNIQMKDEVSLLDYNNTKIFGGYVRSIENKTLKECIVFGYDILLFDIEIQKNFEGYSPEGIIQFCVEFAGLVYNSTISSGLTITLYPAKDKKLKDIVKDMINILGAVGRVDNDKNYYLEYPGETVNDITLEVGQNCVLSKGWNLDTDNLVTQLKVKGALENIILDPVFFSGTASQAEFEVDNIFVSIKVEVDSGSGFVEQVPQISGVQTGNYEIQRETKKIIFQTGSIPPSGTNNIRITYTYDREITYIESSEIILSDKSNLHQKTEKRDYLKTIEDVESFASDYLEKFSTPLISGTIAYNTLNINNFSVNQSIKVIDKTRKINGEFIETFLIIKRIIREFGKNGTSLLIEVGQNTVFSFNKSSEQEYRLKQLEENIATAELLQFGLKTTDFMLIQYDSRINEINRRTFASDTFYLEENTIGTRNQMIEAGTGNTMREVGYTNEIIYTFVLNRVTESSDTRITEDSNIRIIGGDSNDIIENSVVTSIYQSSVITNIYDNLSLEISYLAVGDNNTTPTISDTSLGNQTYIETATVTQSGLILTTRSILDITENNGYTVKELGAFNAASGGDLIFRNLTPEISKDSSTEIRLSNVITVEIENIKLI